ncbi:family 16 glycosylhydrolase [Mucilaginibacter sp. NFR10]|uniref:glycoside hydrolase family 16 protein n=1 Tax=Mucilaginibacter sp. NFR10 TaxID=1566292 RepID=UPI0008716A0B|nr:glycoside hydrolase family 16 protein [Mucilaginibacter sp. NFR10]SCW55612.1 Beta-glucanase, GH16 family [Mucilaginibacter sp. NFR10]
MITKIITVILLIAIPVVGKCQQDTVGGYKLVWADEFNEYGPPSPDNWGLESGFVRNNEDQWYQEQNAICRDGKLIIEARRVHLTNPGYVPNSTNWKQKRQFINYTSSSINTRGKHSFRYGRFIMRGRISTDAGLWPAFWTLGVEKPWPANGEIDIMEYYQNKLLANIACGTEVPYKAKWYSNRKALDTFKANWNKKFHTWRMDWDQNAINLYVDDLLLNHVDLKDLVNQDGTQFNPFMQPHYILLNLAIGGDNGGDPSATKFPKRFEVDYVRVYQKN